MIPTFLPRFAIASVSLLLAAGPARVAEPAKQPLRLMDVFQIQFASDPRISPDGKRIVYVRNFMDVMKDRRFTNLWIINVDGTGHEALTDGRHNDSQPRWSPDGKRVLFLSDAEGSLQLHARWVDSGRTARLTNLDTPPLGPSWSPDGKQIAFVQRIPSAVKPFVQLPAKPKGAEWADPFKFIRAMNYRGDGKGYLPEGNWHVCVVSADGGAPRQLTNGAFDHAGPPDEESGPAWTPDSQHLIFAANRRPDAEHHPIDTELFEVSLADRRLRQLTDRRGPDHYPVVSPDGRHIAYLGFDDKTVSYQQPKLYVMDRDGKNSRLLAGKLDRPIKEPAWSKKGDKLFFLFEDQGITKIGRVTQADEVTTVAQNVGGTYLGRPYASGSFSVAGEGLLAFPQTSAANPGDVAFRNGDALKTLTHLNDNLFRDRYVASAEEINCTAADGRKVQGWLLKPPDFDPKKKYPLILEVHGGPFADYGDRFGLELQLYAAAGYLVLYMNPRGSTGYGEDFAQLIHHRYPGPDVQDLMAGVDALLSRGYVDKDNLFLTGGSGGGILTCWMVGQTNRFQAAVGCFPIVNWTSSVLNTDLSALFTQHWFPGPPWEHAEHYRQRSPLTFVGNVKTPTMLLTGEEDYRTPIPEAEQFFKALKLRKIDTALVRVPGASHNVSARPSHLMAKVAYILEWFETHRKK